MTERLIDAALSLLDRQIEDCDGRMAGKVDDLELTVPEGGGPPVVSAVLAGPGALGPRLGGLLAAAVQRDPARIPFDAVEEVGSTVKLGVNKADLELCRFEDWVRAHFIGHIPGAGRAAE